MKINFPCLLAAVPLAVAWPVDYCQNNCVVIEHTSPQRIQRAFQWPCDVATYLGLHCTVSRQGKGIYSPWTILRALCERHWSNWPVYEVWFALICISRGSDGRWGVFGYKSFANRVIFIKFTLTYAGAGHWCSSISLWQRSKCCHVYFISSLNRNIQTGWHELGMEVHICSLTDENGESAEELRQLKRLHELARWSEGFVKLEDLTGLRREILKLLLQNVRLSAII